ncbi:MAG: tetratricopeptide repeat protein [Kiritimatiellia bacterium]|jgi:tetratricopeptide (TPR) repeat protein
MRNTHTRLLPALIAIAIACCLPQTSHAFFGRERARMLKQADAVFEQAMNAGEEGRVLDEISNLIEARSQYTQIYSRHPGYNADYIQQRVATCSMRIATLNAKIRSGEITLPSPDAVVSGAGKGFVAADTAAPATDADMATMPMPPLLPPSATTDLAPQPERQPAPEPILETPLRVAVTPEPAPIPEPEPEPQPEPQPEPIPTQAVAAGADLDSHTQQIVAILSAADDAKRVQLVQAIIEKDGPSQAMILLEDLVEAEGGKTSETTRALFVKSLVACRNVKRATIELAELRKHYPDSPATLSLAATVAVQQGDLTEAIFQLDKLVERFPAYSDAYVNLAYAYFMLDPVKNRDMAIVYYRTALSYGARRDPKLEEVLELEIEP